MLPDFYGPAPLHHTLLTGTELTGITIQTLHPERFDQGNILLQTPQPGIKHVCDTVEQLSQSLARKGADMLIDCLRNRVYLRGSELPIPRQRSSDVDGFEARHARHAPKIRASDRFIDWESWDGQEILRRQKIIGPLWSLIKGSRDRGERRVIWSTGFQPCFHRPDIDLPIAKPMVTGPQSQGRFTYIRTRDNQVLKIQEAKIEGGEQNEPLTAAIRAQLHNPATMNAAGPLFRSELLSSLPDHA
ncbi:Methionyl-tRNA formyltransferase [Lecanora helva]